LNKDEQSTGDQQITVKPSIYLLKQWTVLRERSSCTKTGCYLSPFLTVRASLLNSLNQTLN